MPSSEEEQEFKRRLAIYSRNLAAVTVGEIMTIRRQVEEDFAARAAGDAVREAERERR